MQYKAKATFKVWKDGQTPTIETRSWATTDLAAANRRVQSYISQWSQAGTNALLSQFTLESLT